jgi:single-strand DNA-binding protein
MTPQHFNTLLFPKGETMKQGFFVGRVGSDAELTYTPQGIAVTKFSIAIDNGKDKEGEKKNATWVKAVIWRERGEKLAPHIKKGIVVAVSGDIDARAWSDKNSGEARCQIEINVDKFTFGGSSSNSGDSSDSRPSGARPNPVAPPPAAPITDEDIPF